MTIAEILDALSYSSSKFPRAAVQEAIAQREGITPELLRVLEEASVNHADFAAQESYMAHLYAMYLLAQFREPRAYSLLVKFVSADHKLVNLMLGDTITEALNRLLASTCHGDSSLLEGMIEDATLDEYIRCAALRALVILVTQKEKSRDDVMGYFKQLFNGKLEREFNLVWAELVALSCDLYPEEVLTEIEQAFEDELIDPWFIQFDSVEEAMADGKDRTLAKIENNCRYSFIEDTVKEMESWAFTPELKITPTNPLPPSIITPAPTPVRTPVPAPVRTTAKVGRNEPCPCGSGKKYKRCCGV